MTASSTSSLVHKGRQYETIYILRSNATKEDAGAVFDRIREVIRSVGGMLTKVDVWGRRKLSYPIEGDHYGIFVSLECLGVDPLVKELERNLRLMDKVVRYQTIKIAENIDMQDVNVVIKDDFSFFEEHQQEEHGELIAQPNNGTGSDDAVEPKHVEEHTANSSDVSSSEKEQKTEGV